jgi:hypothetical protein
MPVWGLESVRDADRKNDLGSVTQIESLSLSDFSFDRHQVPSVLWK